MEKKKIRLWKKILIGFMIILAIFIIYVLRNIIIINNINKKVSKQIENKNVYVRNDMQNTCTEKYRIGDSVKIILNKKNENLYLTQITTPTERKVYYDKDGVRETKTYHDEYNEMFEENQNVIPNFMKSYSFMEKIIVAITSFITYDKLDGKECYVIFEKYSPNYLYDENGTNLYIYVEKDTGLTFKTVEKINNNGTKTDNVNTYLYKFGIVNESDVLDGENKISKEDAEKRLEQKYGTEDETTGNIMSYGYIAKVQDKEGNEYYAFRISWLVDNSHMSFLQNEFVSLDGKIIKINIEPRIYEENEVVEFDN